MYSFVIATTNYLQSNLINKNINSQKSNKRKKCIKMLLVYTVIGLLITALYLFWRQIKFLIYVIYIFQITLLYCLLFKKRETSHVMNALFFIIYSLNFHKKYLKGMVDDTCKQNFKRSIPLSSRKQENQYQRKDNDSLQSHVKTKN